MALVSRVHAVVCAKTLDAADGFIDVVKWFSPTMTTRLYYQDSFLYDFDAEVRDVVDSPRPALILDRTAFYPTRGADVFHTGWISSDGGSKMRVTEVADGEDGKVIHYLEAPTKEVK